MEANIILSICIPTYNRSEYLEETILSIVKQKRFQETNDVEIIISDNCSIDNTKIVSETYVKIYGEKFRYYRNSENIKDANFQKVLSYGKGLFLKLNNDTLIHNPNSLDKIIAIILQHIANKEIIFFSNGSLKNLQNRYCKNLDSFVKTVSYVSTWIGSFGIWNEDFNSFEDFNRCNKLQLVQTDVLFRLISLKNNVWVDNIKLFNSVNPKTKGGYNFYEIFVSNYIGLLEIYRESNQISKFTLFNEKIRLMIHYIVPWTMNLLLKSDKYQFSNDHALTITFKKYRYHPIFYFGIVYLIGRIVLYKIKVLFSKY